MTLSDKELDCQELHSGCLGLFDKKDVKKAVEKLKEELKRGVERNNVFPLDWCFDSIDEIFGDLK